MAAKPQKPPGGKERRGSPVFRARAQEAYEKFRDLIAEHGGTDISEDLSDKPTIEDVMRNQPEMVGALLRTAWQLRTHEALSDYFQSVDDPKTPVTEYDQFIGPCGRTYEDTVQSHLFGAARLYMKRMENEWVDAKLADPKKLGKEFTGGFVNFLRKLVGMNPNVDERALRDTYPSKGLYETLKPFLLDEAQFKLVAAYAGLSTKGAEIIGDIFENLRSTSAIKTACALDPDTLMNARSCAIAYAESEIFAEATADEEGSRKKNINELRRDKDLTARVKKQSAEVFADILNNHVESIGFVERHKAGAENVVRALAPHFKDETWSLLAEEGAVENVINCPANISEYLGRDCRFVDVEVSKFISQLQYPDIGRDIMKILREDVDDDAFFRALKEEACIKVWESIPATFNNEFKYQHDAEGSDTTIKNFKHLKTSSLSVIKDFKNALGISGESAEEAAED